MMHARILFATVAGALGLAVSPGLAQTGTIGHERHLHKHNDPHPTTTDPDRFITNRSSDVVLPLPEETDAFTFVVFGDRTGGPADGVSVLADAVHDTNLIEPDLVMTVGDLVNGYNTHEPWMAQMREFKGIMGELLCPWFPVAGNHDVYWRGDGRPENEHEGDYEMHFGPLWYAFEHKNSWFVVLYSDEANPETGERNFNKPESQRMSPEQLGWLRDTLRKTKDADHVFVFLHHPRWLGGNYGDDWKNVHEALVEAGNVTAVFAGHIHHMRYDGKVNGIEYVTLATVGGGQSELVPSAGYLHQYHIITVRKEQVAMASVPVGTIQDVRDMTGQVAEEAAQLARTAPKLPDVITLKPDGSASGSFRVVMENPTSRPVEVAVTPGSADSRWMFIPDHGHSTIAPGATKELEFHAERLAAGWDVAFRPVDVEVDADYLGEALRYPLKTRTFEAPLALDLPKPGRPDREMALATGSDGASVARVASSLIPLADGAMTLECWMKAERFGNRVGLVAKTESSDYGFFVNNGRPTFSIFIGDSYVEVGSDAGALETGRWYHLAGVFDGAETRLYVDGQLVGSVARRGERRTNVLPLMIGADVDGGGNPTSFFEGELDGVRLSSVARYSGKSFEPDRRAGADDSTLLLLNMDGAVGPFLFDESGARAHARMVGDAEIVVAD